MHVHYMARIQHLEPVNSFAAGVTTAGGQLTTWHFRSCPCPHPHGVRGAILVCSTEVGIQCKGHCYVEVDSIF